ncbi:MULTISPECIES: PH domain-containing protein [Desertihabitans]|nr:MULTISPECIES: PH domain-containing protein [Desertihabitans]
MGVPRKLLDPGEREIVTMRTHAAALWRPVGALVVIAAVAGFAIGLMPDSMMPVGAYVLGGLALAALVPTTLVPFTRWRTSTYTLTTRRLLTRTGVLSRNGHSVPLGRITDIRWERSLGDRLLGSGTLMVHTDADVEPLVLPDVPEVVEVQRMLEELVFGAPEEERRR